MYPECQSDNNTTENEKSHINVETDDNPTAIEDEESDTDSISTVELVPRSPKISRKRQSLTK